VAALPALSLARIAADELAAAEIDAAVAGALARGEELYAIDAEALARLRPDLVVTQTLCTVCAVSGDGVRSALALSALEARVVELEPTTIEGVLASIGSLAALLGVPERGQALVVSLEARLARVEDAVAGAPRIDTFVCEWLDPPFCAGHWVPQMVALAGGREVVGVAAEPSFRTTWDEVRARRPEACVLAPCGLDLAATLAAAAREGVAAQLAGTPALLAGRDYAVDATAYFSRPGPRLVDGVELTAALLHPGRAAALEPPGAAAVLPL
jgi:iron complex transport system substrate-binding protein